MRPAKINTTNEATLIAPGGVVSGDIEFEGQLIIGGEVRGNISGREGRQSLLTVSKGGKVIGEVRVPKVEVHGYMQGDIHAEATFRVSATGRVDGDAYYEAMEMALGAEFNGRLLHTTGGVTVVADGGQTGEADDPGRPDRTKQDAPTVASVAGGSN